MRLLLDENVGIKRWQRRLEEAGHDVERAVDVGLSGAGDEEIVRYACKHNRAILSRDKATQEPDDLKLVWRRADDPKPLLLLVYPGGNVTIDDVARALENLEKAGLAESQMCGIQDWAFYP